MSILKSMKHQIAGPRSAALLTGLVLFLFVGAAFASGGGGGGTAGLDPGMFDEMVDFLVGLLQGSGGKLIAVIGILVALVIGLVSRNLIIALFPFGLALIALLMPDIITGVFGAGVSPEMMAGPSTP